MYNRSILYETLRYNAYYIKIIQKLTNTNSCIPYLLKKRINQHFIKKIKNNKIFLENYRNEIDKYVYTHRKPDSNYNLDLKNIILVEINKIELFLFSIERFVSFI